MIFLNLLEPSYLIFVEVLLLKSHLSDLSFAPVYGTLQDIAHVPEALSNVVMNPFDNRGDVAIEVVEIGDELYKAEIN